MLNNYIIMYQQSPSFDETDKQIAAMTTLMDKKIKACFTGKNIGTIKLMIQDDEPAVLEWLIEVGIDAEIYELCAAARDVLAQRSQPVQG